MIEPSGSETVVILVTAPDAATLEELGGRIVEERLAACLNIVPSIASVYRWQGRVERASEALAVIKTTSARAPALVARIRELHPYELPEVLTLPVAGGSRAYRDWVAACVAEGREDDRA